MSGRELIASLRRRWPLLLVALLLTMAAVTFTVRAVPPTYETTASVVLVPPKSTDDPKANRYLSLGGLSQAASVMVRALNSDATHAAVGITPDRGEYVVATDFTTSAPILIVTATSHRAGISTRLASDVVQQVPKVLAGLQNRLAIGPDSRIVSIELTRDAHPTVLQKTRIRAGIAVGGGVLVLLVLGIGALDGLLLRRAARRDGPRRVDERTGAAARRNGRPAEPERSSGPATTPAPSGRTRSRRRPERSVGRPLERSAERGPEHATEHGVPQENADEAPTPVVSRHR